MKTFLIIVLIVLVLAVIAVQVKMIWDNIKFEFGFKGIDVLNIDLSAISAGTGGNVSVPIRAKVTNDNGFDIPFSGLKVWFYYENTLIVQTSDDLASKSFNAPKHGHIDLVDPVNIYFNNAAFSFLRNLGNKPEVRYKVQMRIFGIPFSYADSFNASIS